MGKICCSLLIALMLTGCVATLPVKLIANSYCDGTAPDERPLVAYRMDRATYPHEVRIFCDVQK